MIRWFFSQLKSYYVNGDYCAKRVLEIINNQNKEEFGTEIQQIKQGKISIKNLSFAYDEKKILDNINLELPPIKTMKNFKACIAKINSQEEYDKFVNSGFFVFQRDGIKTLDETLEILKNHFGL